MTPPLARKFKAVYGLSPTSLPTPDSFEPHAHVNNEEFAKALSVLGYPGFAYLKARVRERNPAEVLLDGLKQDSLESRLVEGLPWLVMNYWDMDQGWLVRNAKLNDLQNRLGFVVTLAMRLSAMSGQVNEDRDRALQGLEKTLEESRLAREDTFLKKANTDVEREWLRQNRSEQAKHWNLLTNWRPEHFRYAF